ncbi:hypothetical protein HYPSUDRAFT_67001 [Hypholoma sublateritium FD-334 SS-4]|uniref:Uncharacterized protein n=1 Tax=Hypholoma sublateritium (strain FD-334 SS-4) TaxID=945553 RepID=A0A0D2PRS3_HYPSF|nr:hypothetical protein HYPSUDRAFT_67001 [Hypholoma sublateritium FD-334 SS-4]
MAVALSDQVTLNLCLLGFLTQALVAVSQIVAQCVSVPSQRRIQAEIPGPWSTSMGSRESEYTYLSTP